MAGRILAFCGHKQSGKSSCVNFLHGYQMKINDVIEVFDLTDNGELLVNAVFTDEKGNSTEAMGVFDIHRDDYDFGVYASEMVWPYIKEFNFADPLKVICKKLFGLTHEQCYGTEDQKNTDTDILWKNMPISGRRTKGKVTSREFMQHFGTNICRKIKSDVWSSSCIESINKTETEIAVISDCRFPDEIDAIKKAGGRVIRLTRNPHTDSHESETSLDKIHLKEFDYVIDNEYLTMEECHSKLLKVLLQWGWVTSSTSSTVAVKR